MDLFGGSSSDSFGKSLGYLAFSGKQKDWRMWNAKFQAYTLTKGCKDVLLGREPVPPHDEILEPRTIVGSTTNEEGDLVAVVLTAAEAKRRSFA